MGHPNWMIELEKAGIVDAESWRVVWWYEADEDPETVYDWYADGLGESGGIMLESSRNEWIVSRGDTEIKFGRGDVRDDASSIKAALSALELFYAEYRRLVGDL